MVSHFEDCHFDCCVRNGYSRFVADVFTKAKRSLVMSAIRSKGNKDTELRLAAILRMHNIVGWRRHYGIRGNPDFVFPKERLAIFVDGCFWHGCPQHGRNPGSNRAYWIPKLRRNKQRDLKVSRQLRSVGWRVLRIWEHRLSDPQKVAEKIRSVLKKPPRFRTGPLIN
jgi:DNA mismatch endonuclease (patch repair protein)